MGAARLATIRSAGASAVSPLLGTVLGLIAAGGLLQFLLGFDPEAEKDLGHLEEGWIHRRRAEENRLRALGWRP